VALSHGCSTAAARRLIARTNAAGRHHYTYRAETRDHAGEWRCDMAKKAYYRHWYSKIDCDVGGKTLADMATELRVVADWLDAMHEAGVEIENATTDGHAEFVTDDTAVAREYGFEAEES
jgi:hypothetical protein